MGELRLTALAVACAVRSRQVVRGEELATLLATASPVAPVVRVTDAARERAVGRSLGVLVLLARVPGGGWRNTCLFRSVAECLLLRALGHPAIVRLGVARGARDEVEAHAWAECDGVRCRTAAGDEPARYAPLRRA